MHTAHYTALTLATAETPASLSAPALTHLIGAAFLVAERGQGSRWTFTLDAMTPETSETELVNWLSDRLPEKTTVIGWQIGARLLPALLDATAHAEAPLAYRLASSCAQAFAASCIDLALKFGGVAAPPFDQVACAAGFALAMLDDQRRFDAWAFSSMDGVRRELEQEAVTLWRLWLRQGCDHVDAIDATTTWLAARR